MIRESVIVNLFITLFNKIKAIFAHSKIVILFKNIFNALAKSLSDSCIVKFIKKDDIITRTYQDSITYKILDSAINFPVRMLRKAYKKAYDVFSESLVFKILKTVLDRFEIVTGVGILFIFIIKHEKWDNLYSLIIAFLLYLAFIIKSAMSDDTEFKTQRLDLIFVIFAITVLVAGITSISVSDSLRFIFFYITCFLTVLVIVSSINSTESLNTFINIILIGVFIMSIYAIWQSIIGVPSDPSLTDVSSNEGMPGRVYSTVDNPNNFAEILVMAIPFFIGAIFNAKKISGKFLYALMLVPSLVALALTGSRSGWIAFAFTLPVILFFKRRSLIPAFILLAVASIPFLPAFIINRVLTLLNPDNDTSILYRLKIYQTFMPMLKDHWKSGIGLGTDIFMKVIESYYRFTEQTPLHTHNLYLQVWIESGITAFIAFIYLLARTVKKGIKGISGNKDKTLQNILIAAVASVLGISVIGLVEYIWYYPRVMLMFWIIVAILLSSTGLVSKEKQEDNI